jgi:hypothetical protein
MALKVPTAHQRGISNTIRAPLEILVAVKTCRIIFFAYNIMATGTAGPYSEYSNQQLVDELRNHPDFDKFIFPSTWYKKYNIPPATVPSMADYLRENHWFRRMFGPTDLPPIVIKDASGGAYPWVETTDGKMTAELVSKMLDEKVPYHLMRPELKIQEQEQPMPDEHEPNGPVEQ